MSDRPLCPWPPEPGQRIHMDSGHARSSWTALVLGVFDDSQVAVKEWSPDKQRWLYRFEDRFLWRHGEIRLGPLPRVRLYK